MSDEKKTPDDGQKKGKTVRVDFGTVIAALGGKPFKWQRFGDDDKPLPKAECPDLTLGQVCIDALQGTIDPKHLGAVSPKMIRDRHKTQSDLARRIFADGKWPTLDLTADEAVFLADLVPFAYQSPAVCGPVLELLGG